MFLLAFGALSLIQLYFANPIALRVELSAANHLKLCGCMVQPQLVGLWMLELFALQDIVDNFCV